MNQAINSYNESQSETEARICHLLAETISKHMPDAENKIWHGHPVWFLAGNPIVGYSKQKGCIRLMFWSGASFEEEKLEMGTGKFKDASIRYKESRQVDLPDLERWLEKSRAIQWDYKNVVKRKGRLERLR